MAKKKQESNKGAFSAPEVTKEAVNETAKAEETTVTEAPKGKTKNAVYTVKVPFRDSKEYSKGGKFNEYTEGVDVSDLDPERLENLVKRGIVEKQ